ncbi:hypothetical protein TREMEDRAFT_63011 [Tremella mesenterica DSM 1558]|uniref:uncharacterized protein n=1 Tax=Tremella mesenterica (strain ATCC 24925 / CBS 8224 / DSM 1558 / NBRC 9311 / NRRL Y-6157 / RJB 2259-6 / UBC 559-6) TaxID=578456 RepID=UPI0003F490C9|nr:uncharacterized protein TREMEDRAFT_63011 [Tremella mesenterica DSM 1558]EIW68545.1 hypothetical protein TREMEDRAFT_63011 [Tremella mesenterica DSM 1558]
MSISPSYKPLVLPKPIPPINVTGKPQLRIVTSFPTPVKPVIVRSVPILIKSAPLFLPPPSPTHFLSQDEEEKEKEEKPQGLVVKVDPPGQKGHKRRLSDKFKSIFHLKPGINDKPLSKRSLSISYPKEIVVHPQEHDLSRSPQVSNEVAEMKIDENVARREYVYVPQRPHRSPDTASYMVTRHNFHLPSDVPYSPSTLNSSTVYTSIHGEEREDGKVEEPSDLYMFIHGEERDGGTVEGSSTVCHLTLKEDRHGVKADRRNEDGWCGGERLDVPNMAISHFSDPSTLSSPSSVGSPAMRRRSISIQMRDMKRLVKKRMSLPESIIRA